METTIEYQQAYEAGASARFVSKNFADIYKVIGAVCGYFATSLEELKQRKRNRAVCYPRQVAIYLIRKYCKNASLMRIGDLFSLSDHTSTRHSIKAISDLLEVDSSVRSDIETLQGIINQQIADSKYDYISSMIKEAQPVIINSSGDLKPSNLISL